ncbi:MAG: segregation/condensation protein A [Pseudomonadota bacterium]
MDLLVYLVKKNDLDIYDIPIALITDQYLQYLELMKELSLELSGEFLIMAATLMHIKSKMLIPTHDYEENDEADDPRMEIVRPLTEYVRLKGAAERLSQLSMLDRDTFVRQPLSEDIDAGIDISTIPLRPVGIFELIDAFRAVLKNLATGHLIDITKETISVKQRISYLVDLLETKESITFQELFVETYTKQMVIVTFLAILEMVKLGLIRVLQYVDSGIIRLYGVS